MPKTRKPDRLRGDADAIWQRIFNHPFVLELYDGTLPLEKFRFYVLQDYYFLTGMMKTLSLLAAKAETLPQTRELLQIAYLEATDEIEGYERLLRELGYSLEDATGIAPTEVTTSYISFLLATASLKSYGEGLAAILPCFWSYAEIARFHKERLSKNKNRLYTDWASVYLSEPYLGLVERLKRLLNDAPVEYRKLKEVFTLASRYEYSYWDMAYKAEPV